MNPVDNEEDFIPFGASGSRSKLEGAQLRNSANILTNESPTHDKPRVLVRKVSKVSILSTARKVENNKIMTE